MCWIRMEPVRQTKGKKSTHVHVEAGYISHQAGLSYPDTSMTANQGKRKVLRKYGIVQRAWAFEVK